MRRRCLTSAGVDSGFIGAWCLQAVAESLPRNSPTKKQPAASQATSKHLGMPRYFFHVQDGHDYPDLEGTELPDLAAARAEAVQFAGSLLADQPETFWASGEWICGLRTRQALACSSSPSSPLRRPRSKALSPT